MNSEQILRIFQAIVSIYAFVAASTSRPVPYGRMQVKYLAILSLLVAGIHWIQEAWPNDNAAWLDSIAMPVLSLLFAACTFSLIKSLR